LVGWFRLNGIRIIQNVDKIEKCKKETKTRLAYALILTNTFFGDLITKDRAYFSEKNLSIIFNL